MRLPERPDRNRFNWVRSVFLSRPWSLPAAEFIGTIECFEVLRSGDCVSGQSESSIAGAGTGCRSGWQRSSVFHFPHFYPSAGNLVEGVRALEKGDFTYALDARGGDEAAEVTRAFNRMRSSLRKTQQELLEAERLATIGRMASSISHDLRHSLAAIVANAEFLCESRLSSDQREELYQEVRAAVNQMTDLIDSLLEFSRTRESLRPSYGNVRDSVERVVQATRLHPEFHQVSITVSQEGGSSGWFDAKKLERVLL